MAFLYNLTDTWDDSGTTYNGLKLNVTNTASAANSKIFDFQLGGTTYANLDKDGTFTVGQGSIVASGATITGTATLSGANVTVSDGTAFKITNGTYDLQFNADSLGQDSTFTFPNFSSGTVALTNQNQTISGTQTFTGTITATSATVNLPSGAVDAITEIASGLKTGSDSTLVTGTAGSNGQIAQWNSDGDLVTSSLTASGSDSTLITGTAGTNGQYAQWNADGDIIGADIPDTDVDLTAPSGTGGVSIPLSTWIATDKYLPSQFGVVGDGSTNDIVAINRWLSAAAADGVVAHCPDDLQMAFGDGVTADNTAWTISLPAGLHLVMHPDARFVNKRVVSSGNAALSTLSNMFAGGTGSLLVDPFPTAITHPQQSGFYIEGGGILNSDDNYGFGLIMNNCEDVRIWDFEIDRTRSGWATQLWISNADINGLRVMRNQDITEDGLHIIGGSNIRATNCFINSGDDAISMRESVDLPLENVSISNCVVNNQNGAAIAFGKNRSGSREDYATPAQVHRNISVSNITGEAGIVKGGAILFDRADGTNGTGSTYAATPNNLVKDVTISNCSFTISPDNEFTDASASYAGVYEMGENILIDNVTIRNHCGDGHILRNQADVTFNNCHIIAPSTTTSFTGDLAFKSETGEAVTGAGTNEASYTINGGRYECGTNGAINHTSTGTVRSHNAEYTEIPSSTNAIDISAGSFYGLNNRYVEESGATSSGVFKISSTSVVDFVDFNQDVNNVDQLRDGTSSTPSGKLKFENEFRVFDGPGSGLSPNGSADAFVIDSNGITGLSILSNSDGFILFGKSGDDSAARIQFDNSADKLIVGSSTSGGTLSLRSGDNTEAIGVDASQNVTIPAGSLTVTDGADPGIAANAVADAFIIQSTGNTGFSILSDADGYLIFGDGTDATGGRLQWDSSATQMNIGTTTTGGKLRFNVEDGDAAIIADTNEVEFFKPIVLDSYTTAQAEALANETVAGSVVYVTDGDAGSPCLGVSNGTNFLRVALGAAISAT